MGDVGRRSGDALFQFGEFADARFLSSANVERLADAVGRRRTEVRSVEGAIVD